MFAQTNFHIAKEKKIEVRTKKTMRKIRKEISEEDKHMSLSI